MIVLTFDGDVTGKETFEYAGKTFVKISDTAMDLSKVTKLVMRVDPTLAEAFGMSAEMEITEGFTVECEDNAWALRDSEGMYIVFANGLESATAKGTFAMYQSGSSMGWPDIETAMWISRIEFEETTEPTAPIGYIEYLTNPKYHTIKLFYDIIGWKLAQKGCSADGEPALVSSDGYTLQDVNGLKLIPKESE